MKLQKLSAEMQTFLTDLAWAESVPIPAVDLAIIDGKPLLRLSRCELREALAGEPQPMTEPGSNHFEMIGAIAKLAEEWVRAHDADPGVYPTGIRGQILHRLDMRTAARWHYEAQLATALALAPSAL